MKGKWSCISIISELSFFADSTVLVLCILQIIEKSCLEFFYRELKFLLKIGSIGVTVCLKISYFFSISMFLHLNWKLFYENVLNINFSVCEIFKESILYFEVVNPYVQLTKWLQVRELFEITRCGLLCL